MPINKVLDKNGKPVKKDGKQKYRVRINYTDSYGKAKQLERTAYGVDEAKQLERELTIQLKEEKPARRMTVQQLYDEYIAVKKHEVRESTLDKAIRVLSSQVLPTLGNVKIDKLTVPVLQSWKQSINEKNYKLATKQGFYKNFKTMLNYAVKMEYLSTNTLEKVGNFQAPMELDEEMDFYTPEEFKKFISVARAYAENNTDIQAWNYYIFFNIAFFTGMRKGEIYALQWTDIKDGEINITKSVTQKSKGKDILTPPKNKPSIRSVQIPQPLSKVLKEHKIRCQALDGFSEDLYICGGIYPVRNSSIQNINKSFAKAANVKSIRIHDFRHSHASLLANNGINIQEIAKRLGHANANITLKTYAHLYPKESERALSILNQIEIE